MKMRTFIVAAIAVGLIVAYGFTQADSTPRRQGPRDGEERARMIEQFDRDGDGRLSDEERAAAREERRADRPGRNLRRGDGPRDGQGLRGDGFGPRRDGSGPGAIIALMRFDADNDGKLSDEELAAIRTEYEARHQQLIEQFDTDGDGQLSPEERREAFGPRRRPAGPDSPAADENNPRPRQRPATERPRNRQAD